MGQRIPINVRDSQQKSWRWIEGCLYLRLVGTPFSIYVLGPSIWAPRRVGLVDRWHAEENLQRCVVGITGSSQKSWCFLDKRSDNQVLSQEKPLRFGWTSPGGAGSSVGQLMGKENSIMGPGGVSLQSHVCLNTAAPGCHGHYGVAICITVIQYHLYY